MSTHPSTEPGAAVTATAVVKLPFVVMLLAVGTFLTATTEFVIAGLLPELAADLDVSVARAGLLITAFAVGMIVGAPLIAIATARVPQRSTLVAALLVFSAGHVVAAISSSFTVVLIARIVTALATGTFLAVAAAVAVAAVGAANGARAMGTLMSGVALATVVGVPLGSFVGQLVGWRGVFWGLAVVSAFAAAGIARLVPHSDRETTSSLREQAGVLTQGRLWLVLAATALVTGGFMAAFSFVSPLLTERTGLSGNVVPLVLVGFGVGSLIGTNLAGRFGDRGPLRTFTVITLSSTAVLLLLIPLSTMTVPTIVLVVLLGASGMAVTAIATPSRSASVTTHPRWPPPWPSRRSTSASPPGRRSPEQPSSPPSEPPDPRSSVPSWCSSASYRSPSSAPCARRLRPPTGGLPNLTAPLPSPASSLSEQDHTTRHTGRTPWSTHVSVTLVSRSAASRWVA